MNIMLFKLYNGDFIMGEVDYDSYKNATTICIKNPRQVMMMPTMAGSMGIALKQICFPFVCDRLKNEISIYLSQVMFSLVDNELDNALINGYKSEISGIKIATVADTAALTSSASSSSKEFII